MRRTRREKREAQRLACRQYVARLGAHLAGLRLFDACVAANLESGLIASLLPRHRTLAAREVVIPRIEFREPANVWARWTGHRLVEVVDTTVERVLCCTGCGRPISGEHAPECEIGQAAADPELMREAGRLMAESLERRLSWYVPGGVNWGLELNAATYARGV